MTGNNCIWYPDGTYSGEVLGWWPERVEHGRGVFKWTDGDRFEGDYLKGVRTGRGAFLFGDNARRFEGAWADDRPLHGTALDQERIIYRAEFDGTTHISDAWGAEAVPRGWRRWGQVMKSRPAEELLGAWAGTLVRDDGTRFEGILHGLCPLGGVETNASGARCTVTYAGELTLAEDPPPLTKEVPHIASAASAASVRFGHCILGLPLLHHATSPRALSPRALCAWPSG